MDCTPCGRGQVATVAGASSCSNCSIGRFADAAAADCAVCAPGRFAGSPNQDACKDCVSCPSGNFRSGCDATAPGQCKACGPCPEDYTRVNCFDDRQGLCVYSVCGFGEYKNTTLDACVPCTGCAAGKFRVACAGTSVRQQCKFVLQLSMPLRLVLCASGPAARAVLLKRWRARRWRLR